MTKVEMPETVRQYFSDDYVKTAVDGMLPKIENPGGKSRSFPEARDWNTALHIAAQTRYEYVDMMLKLWNETWGQSKFIWSNMDRSLDDIWETSMVGFTLKSQHEVGRDYEGYLYFAENLELHLYKVSTKSPSKYPAMKTTNLPSKSWVVADDEEGLKYALFETEHTSQFECLEKFETSLAEAKRATFDILRHLSLT